MSETAGIQDFNVSYFHIPEMPEGAKELALQTIAMPGKLVVAMCPKKTLTESGLHIPEGLQEDLRPDTGVIISSGVKGLSKLDFVLVKPWHGDWVEGFGWENPTNLDVRYYGCWGGTPFHAPGEADIDAQTVPVEQSVMATIKDGELTPTGNNLIVKLNIVDRQGSIELSEKHIDPVCEVVAVGRDVLNLSVGDRVVIHEGGVQRILKNDGDDSLAILNEAFVFAKYLP
jgi:hypothetical protein